MQIQSVGLNTVIPTVQHRQKQAVPHQISDSVSFGSKEQVAQEVVKKPIFHHVKSLIGKLKPKASKVESPIKLPQALNFDELISSLEASEKKYEIIPATLGKYKSVTVSNSAGNPVREYGFRKNGTHALTDFLNSEGNLQKSYTFKKNGELSSAKRYTRTPEGRIRTNAFIEVKPSGEMEVVKLNPYTNRHFEQVENYEYTKNGTWVEHNAKAGDLHPETNEVIRDYPRVEVQKFPGRKQV